MSELLIFLTIIPLSCYQLTKIFPTPRRWMLCGVLIGMVIAPISFGLVQFTYVPVIGKIIGFIGLIFNLTHGSVGYFCLIGSGVIDTGFILSTSQLVMINIVNAVLFSYCYGMVGHFFDKVIQEAAPANNSALLNGNFLK